MCACVCVCVERGGVRKGMRAWRVCCASEWLKYYTRDKEDKYENPAGLGSDRLDPPRCLYGPK